MVLHSCKARRQALPTRDDWLNPRWQKELLGLHDGYRESTDSWAELIIELKSQGLKIDPKLLIGDGAMGLWAAANKHWADTPHQRCWVHKTANILNKLPKSMQPKVKESLQNIWMAETKKGSSPDRVGNHHSVTPSG